MKTEFNRKDYAFARQAPKGGYWDFEERADRTVFWGVMLLAVVVAVVLWTS